MAKKETAPAVAPVDEHEGKGGSYVIHPDTGVRTLVERTKSAEEAEADKQTEVSHVSTDA